LGRDALNQKGFESRQASQPTDATLGLGGRTVPDVVISDAIEQFSCIVVEGPKPLDVTSGPSGPRHSNPRIRWALLGTIRFGVLQLSHARVVT
jgi:hypothetical protein